MSPFHDRSGARARLIAGLSALATLLAAPAADAKTLRINIVADPAQIDPVTQSELVSGRILKNEYEGFTDIAPDGSVRNVLAERWEPIADGKGYRFFLRKGVSFHTGRPFTARDVKATYEALLKPGSKAGLSAPYLANIAGAADVKDGKTTDLAGVTVVDDTTVDIVFTKPEVLFPIYPVLFFDTAVVKDQGEDWATKVSAGTGPFQFKQWRRGSAFELTAFAKYWGGAPKIDGVTFSVVPNADTALAQYDAGELDFVDVYEGAFRRVLRDERYKADLIRVPRAQVRYLGLNQTLYAPFQDKRVREAVSLSIDRKAIVEGLYGGAAFPTNGFVTPGVPGYSAGLAELRYDPERAKTLLAEAGYSGAKPLPPVEIATTEPNKAEAAYFADQIGRTLGWDIKVRIAERATFIKALNAGEVPFFPWAWTIDYPDAASYLADMWHSSSPYNRVKWKNADYDAALDAARATIDPAARNALYAKAEKILLDDWGALPLPTTAILALRKPNVRNVTLTPFGLTPLKDVTID